MVSCHGVITAGCKNTDDHQAQNRSLHLLLLLCTGFILREGDMLLQYIPQRLHQPFFINLHFLDFCLHVLQYTVEYTHFAIVFISFKHFNLSVITFIHFCRTALFSLVTHFCYTSHALLHSSGNTPLTLPSRSPEL